MKQPLQPPVIAFAALVFAALLVPPPTLARQEDPPVPGVASQESIAEALRFRIEAYRSSGILQSGETTLAAPDLVAEVYESRRFAPIWTDDSARLDLFEGIRQAPSHGLLTRDYHLRELEGLGLEAGLPLDPFEAAERELLMTDALVRLAFHLRFGKVDPVALDPNWNFQAEFNHIEPAQALEGAVESGDLLGWLSSLAPVHPFYDRLRSALLRYQRIQAEGGWPTVPEGPTLRSGERSVRVTLVRERLAATGDMGGGSDSGGLSSVDGQEGDGGAAMAGEDPTLFDPALEDAVRRFQRRHGLEVDGAVGRETLAAMNVPVDARVDQIRVNLERGRWILRDLASEFVVVNIAGFEVSIVRGDSTVWQSRAQVGTTYRKTPLFRAEMSYIVFSPTWTVPPTILRQDVIPSIKADPGYLADRHMEVLDHSGTVIDPASIDWSSVSPGNFPYVIRQQPGPWNSLGRAKFIFPNPHFVFIHDTPSTGLFDQSVRTFSSGCIRIEDPEGFAVQVLKDPVRWSPSAVKEAFAGDETRTVHLPQKMPVLIQYWTASRLPDGEVQFLRDVYDRDPAILRGLNGDFALWRTTQ